MPIIGIQSSAGMKPTTPTIGTATDGGTGTTASVAFTPSTYIGKGTITYTATSSPDSITATGSASPITVSGLTTGTAYTFTVNGTTNYGVTSDSSAASNSVTPASPSSFESIATITPSGTGVVTFSSIPSTYKHLQIRGLLRSTRSVALDAITLTINGDTSTNYDDHYFQVSGSAIATGFDGTNTTSFTLYRFPGATATANIFGNTIIDFVEYANVNKYKTIKSITGADLNGNGIFSLGSAAWRSTSAINSITLSPGASSNWATGTQFALYGIKG